MTDIASLVLRIDSLEADEASRRLRELGRAGQDAERATTTLTRATHILAGAAKAAASAFGAYKLVSYIQEATLLAARYETMGVVMRIAGNNAGYTMGQMEEFSKSLQKSGISMLQSRNSLTQLATANIDLANATKLGRAAQDLAVVGNTNSSDALGRMIHGIRSGEVETLRTLGLNVSFEASYKKLATQLGVNSTALTEQQKVTARTNAALAEAVRYNGIYEESLTTAGKAMSSLSRYFEDFKVMVGEVFLPALAQGVFAVTDQMKGLNKELSSTAVISSIGQAIGSTFGVVVTMIEPAVKVAAAYFALFVAAPAILTAAGAAFAVVANAMVMYAYNVAIGQAATIGLNTALYGTSVNAMLAAGSLTAIKLAGMSMFALFAGWQIGTYLRDNFAEARIAGLAFVGALMTGFENIKYGALIAMAAIGSLVPGSEGFSVASAKITAAHQKELTAIEDNIVGLVAYELASKNTSKAVAGVSKMTEEARIAASKATAEAEVKKAAAAALAAEEAKKAASAYTQAVSQAKDYIQSLKEETEELGLSADQIKMMAAARAAAKAPTAALRMEVMQTASAFSLAVKAQREALEAAKENTKAVDELFDAQEKLRLANEDQTKTGRTMLDQIEFETRLLGLNAEQRALATMERELERQGIVKGTQAYDAYIEKLREATATKGIAEASKKVNDEQVADWKKTIDQYDNIFREGFAGMINGGQGAWKSFTKSLATTFKTSVADQVYKTFAQPFVVKFVASMLGITGTGVAGVAQAASGGSSLLSAAGTASSLYSMGSATLGGLASGATSLAGIMTATGSQVATAVSYGTAIGSTQTAMLAAQEAGMGLTSSLGSLSSTLAAVPVWGWVALAGLAVLGMSGGPTSTRSTGYVNRQYGADGSLLSSSTDANGIGEAGGVLDGIYKSIAGVQASLGAKGGASLVYNSNTGRESADPQFYLKTGSYDSGELQKNDANISLAISRTILTAIQDSELPKYLQGAFDGMVAGSMSQEQINAAITGGQALKAFNDQLLALPFANLADLSFSATQSLIGFSGGLDQLKTNLGSYYENFYTAEEKTAQLTLNTGKAFESLGLSMPALDEGARAAYRSMVELAGGQDLSVEANAKTYAGLLALNPAMNQLAPAIDNVATSVADSIAKMNAAVQSAQNVAVQMGITTAYAVAQSAAQAAYDAAIKAAPALAGFSERQIVAYAADPTKRGELDAKTFDVIDTLVAAIGAWNAAQTTERGSVGASSGTYTTDTSYTPDTSAADAARLLNDQLAMQARLFELTGDKAAAAAILEQQHVIALASLDPSLRGFQSQIWDLEASALNAASSVAALKSSLDIKTGAASDALSGVKSAVDAQRKIAQVSVSVAQESVSALNSVFDLLKSNVNDLYGSVDSTKQLQAAQGSAFITQALATAKASGYLPDSKDLADAISKSRSGIDATVYASQQEADFARLVMAGELAQLQDISGDQLTIAEKALAYAKDQITALDDILGTAQAQLDAVNGVNTSVLSVADALNAFAISLTALMTERAAQKLSTSTAAATAANYVADLGGSYKAPTQAANPSTGFESQINSLYASGLGRQADAAGLDYWASSGLSISQISAAIGSSTEAGIRASSVEEQNKFLSYLGSPIKAYANGGMHSGGLRWVGENGPELEATGPSRIWNAQQLSGAIGSGNNSRLEALIEGLTKQVQTLQKELVAIKTNTGQVAEQIDEVTEGGNAIRSRAVGVAA